MKNALKKFLPMLLTVCILFTGISIPASAVIDTEGQVVTANNTYVCVSDKVIYENGKKTGRKVKGVSFNAKTKTLTLDNYKGKYINCYGFGTIKLKLKGKNMLTSGHQYSQFDGPICVGYDTLKIVGQGKLTLKANKSTRDGIGAGKVFIQANLNVVAKRTPQLPPQMIINTKKGGSMTISVKSKDPALTYLDRSYFKIKGKATIKEGANAKKAQKVSKLTWISKSIDKQFYLEGWYDTIYQTKRYISIKPK